GPCGGVMALTPCSVGVRADRRRVPLVAILMGTLLGAAGFPARAQYAPISVDLGTDLQDFTLYGISDHERAGSAVLVADLNGDGIADIVIGARGAKGPSDTRGDFTGEVYIRFGTSRYGRTQDLFTSPPDVTIYGVDAGDQLGRVLAAGDLNA